MFFKKKKIVADSVEEKVMEEYSTVPATTEMCMSL